MKATPIFIILGLLATGTVYCQEQGSPGSPSDQELAKQQQQKADDEAKKKKKEEDAQKQRLLDAIEHRKRALEAAARDGIEVRIADIARFRGVRSNQLIGIGLVTGLAGTGDSKKTPITTQLVANWLRSMGNTVDATQFNLKNVAVVTITAELPAFATPGNKIDVTVSSWGDATSLQGGTLQQAALYARSDPDKAYVSAQGTVSLGGFQAGANGSSAQKNHPAAGIVTDGGDVLRSVPTNTVFDGKVYLELASADFTTAKRIAATLNEEHPEYGAAAINAGTISVNVPSDLPAVTAMAEIEQTKVMVNIPAVVVVNERTGTIVVGGNVKLGPAIVIKGGLTVKIDTVNAVSQPLPFAPNGQTVKVSNSNVSAEESTTQVGVVIPNTTVADLARIFLELKVSASDIIAILEALKAQGALQAQIKVQ